MIKDRDNDQQLQLHVFFFLLCYYYPSITLINPVDKCIFQLIDTVEISTAVIV